MPEELSMQMRFLRAAALAVGLFSAAIIYSALMIEVDHYHRMVKAGTIWCLLGNVDRCVASAAEPYQ